MWFATIFHTNCNTHLVDEVHCKLRQFEGELRATIEDAVDGLTAVGTWEINISLNVVSVQIQDFPVSFQFHFHSPFRC